MVATEERKIAARNAAVKEEEGSKRGPTQAKGKAAKDAIVHESKSAGKIADHTKAEET